MNVDTGEILRMDADERDELNRIALKELWVQVTDSQANLVEEIGKMEPMNRKERRKAFRSMNGRSQFEQLLRR